MFVLNFDLDCWITKWIDITYKYLWIVSFFMVIYNLFNSFFGQNILFMISFDKDISNIFILNRHFGHLDFSTTVVLQSSDGLALLPDDQTYSVVRYRDDVRVW